jgi:hypothetical protein
MRSDASAVSSAAIAAAICAGARFSTLLPFIAMLEA